MPSITPSLRASEARFRDLIEGSIQGVLIHRNSAPLFANQALAEMFGYATPDAMLQLGTTLALFAPYERDRLMRDSDARMRGEPAPVSYECQGVRQDGTLIWLDNKVRVIDWEGQRCIQSTLFDITQRKRAAEMFRGLVETAPDAMVIVNADGDIVLVNALAETLFGYTREAVLGQPVEMLIPEGVRSAHRAQRRSYLSNREARPMGLGRALYGLRQDGSTFPAEISLSPLETEGGVLVSSTIRDITARQQAEEERNHLEIQLQQAQKMEAIGTLAGGIAHDFNNILSAILGFTELTLDDVPEESVPWHNLQEVLTAGTRAKSLVQQILTFSRQSNQERHPLQLALIIKEALTLLRASLPSTIEIQQHVANDAGTVLADPTQLHQVLMNLCTNAAHAMRETGGILETRVEAVEVDDAFAAQHPPCTRAPMCASRLAIRGTGWRPTCAHASSNLFSPQKRSAKALGWACQWFMGSSPTTMGPSRSRVR